MCNYSPSSRNNTRTDLTNKIRIEAYQSTITSHIKQKKKTGDTQISGA